MAESILTIVSGIVSYLAAFGIDKLIAKWVAAFTIAWEERASRAAVDEYLSQLTLLKLSLKDNQKKQESWWKKKKDQ